MTFKELDSRELKDQELVECIISTGAFETEDDIYDEMFVVGTSIAAADGLEEEQMRGRILVYEVNREKKIKQVTELSVKGACRSFGDVRWQDSCWACQDGERTKLLAVALLTLVGRTIWLGAIYDSRETHAGAQQTCVLPHLHQSAISFGYTFDSRLSCRCRRRRSYEIPVCCRDPSTHLEQRLVADQGSLPTFCDCVVLSYCRDRRKTSGLLQIWKAIWR